MERQLELQVPEGPGLAAPMTGEGPRLDPLGEGHTNALKAACAQVLDNPRSHAAMAKLGAVREGVLRAASVTWTGHVRDTVIFSILANEWPEVPHPAR